ncbi:MAG: PEP-CTERM sorting domain-containing protein, partial [Mariniblastus sp.]|nr:PEP-CTERM sorting domain-containing protein [Mariniblastus sp.]
VTMDIVSGLTNGLTKSTVDGTFTGTSFIDAAGANSVVFSATSDGSSPTGSVRYDFDNGLNDFLGGLTYSLPSSEVRFEVAMDSTIAPSGGNFVVTGRYFESGSGTGTVFSTLTSPSSGGSRVVMYTGVTMNDLQTTDIDAVEWTVSFGGGGNIGLQNVFTFGNSNGLIAAPEPTSAAMIGCALVGLIARRRRKA